MHFLSKHLSNPFCALFIFSFLFSCAHSKIPETDIDDTSENREILSILDKYRLAFENRDAEGVLALVSTDFYETNGTSDPADDYDYRELREKLQSEFTRSEKVQVLMRVDAIEVDDDKAIADVYYTVRAQNAYPSGTKWETGSDRSRLKLKRTGKQWLLTSGF